MIAPKIISTGAATLLQNFFYYEIDFLMFLEQKMLQIFVIDFFPFNFDKNQLWSTFSLFLQSFEIGT